MSGYIYFQSLRECLRFKRLFPWALVGFVTLIIAALWQRIMPDSTPSERYGDLLGLLVFRIVPLASTVFSTAVIGQEVEQKTIVYLLTRPVSRTKLLIFRYLSSVTAVALIGIVITLGLSAVCLHGLSNATLLKDIGAIILGAFAYGALFTFFSLIVNRSLLICLLYSFGWESSVPNMPGNLYKLSILSYMQGVSPHGVGADPDKKLLALLSGMYGDKEISSLTGLMTLTIFTLVVMFVSVLWFENFEYVPREDAE